MSEFTHYVGLDVSKSKIAVGVAEAGRADPRSAGCIRHDVPTLRRSLERIGKPGQLLVAYEAGPTGYGLARALLAAGYECQVVAPSKTPIRAGDRIKTDRRDALMLARYLRSGELVSVTIPDESVEALRDLVRARYDAKKAHTVVRHQLGKYLIRHDRVYPGRSNWTKAHHEWIAQQRFENAAQEAVLVDHIHAEHEAGERVERLTADIERLAPESAVGELIVALQALRGVRLVSAASLAVELGDLRRFARPSQLMGYLGLVPSESSSGTRTQRGAITRTGNGHARRVLIESAWAYRCAPRITRTIAQRQRPVSPAVRAIAWKAQRRLHHRWRTLKARGKDHRRVITAIARELAGFVWSIGQQQPLLAEQH